jgi:hypothetical protein
LAAVFGGADSGSGGSGGKRGQTSRAAAHSSRKDRPSLTYDFWSAPDASIPLEADTPIETTTLGDSPTPDPVASIPIGVPQSIPDLPPTLIDALAENLTGPNPLSSEYNPGAPGIDAGLFPGSPDAIVAPLPSTAWAGLVLLAGLAVMLMAAARAANARIRRIAPP